MGLLGLPSVVPAVAGSVAGSGFFASAVPVPVWLVLAGLGTVSPLVPAVLVLPLPALVAGCRSVGTGGSSGLVLFATARGFFFLAVLGTDPEPKKRRMKATKKPF